MGRKEKETFSKIDIPKSYCPIVTKVCRVYIGNVNIWQSKYRRMQGGARASKTHTHSQRLTSFACANGLSMFVAHVPQTQKGYFHITSTFSHLSLHYLNFEDWKEQRSTYLPCLETPSIQSLCYPILWVYIGKLFHTKMVTFLIYLGFNWPWKETNRKDTNTLKTHKWAIKSGEWVDSHFHNV